MSDFEIIHKPYRPKSVYAIKPKGLHNPLVDVAVIFGLVLVLLLTGYIHI